MEIGTLGVRQAYRLVFAYQASLLLQAAKCGTLPTHESQVRPLSRLDEGRPGLPGRGKNACLMKKQGKVRAAADVTRAVNQIAIPKTHRKGDQELGRYVKLLRRSRRTLGQATEILTDGDLDDFLLASKSANDPKAVKKRQRIAIEILSFSKMLIEHGKQFSIAEKYPT